MNAAKKIPLIRRPWFAFLSSMRFAVALLSVLGIASVVGTVLQQNQRPTDYVVKFGPFWSEIFRFLGLYDVYASGWFVLIMVFLVLSTGLCLWRNIPPFMREMKSFRLQAKAQSLSAMRHSVLLDAPVTPEVAARYLSVRGFVSKTAVREDGSVIVAAKKGSANKLGYVCAHAALIVICLGGLIDSNLLLKAGMLTGRIVPDENSMFAKDFKPESIMGENNISFRGNVNVIEGQTADVVFLNADKGMLVQNLPFSVTLKKFHIDFYNTGMPKDFASDLVITDKKTGAQSEHTIRVNHPLTVEGVTIYQASFADGGSDLKFKAWDLGTPSRRHADLQAKSMAAFPLNLAARQYRLEFDQFTAMNVEDMTAPQAEKDFRGKLNDVRAVRQEKRFTNIGPSVIYRLRDGAGQAVEYKNYMLPVDQGGFLFYITGTRGGLEQQYRWLRIPADENGRIDTFMALRELMNDGALRERIVRRAAEAAPQDVRSRFGQAVNNTLELFVRHGFPGIEKFIGQAFPASEQQRMREYYYQIVYGAVNAALEEGMSAGKLPNWAPGGKRNLFVGHALEAYSGLKEYPAPVLLQLDGFKEVRSSGLQMTRSPGALLVYLGSALLVLGTVFMFYIREKRVWLLFDGGKVRFAMSSSRSERDLEKEFPEHVRNLKELGEDLNHE